MQAKPSPAGRVFGAVPPVGKRRGTAANPEPLMGSSCRGGREVQKDMGNACFSAWLSGHRHSVARRQICSSLAVPGRPSVQAA